MEEIVHSAYTGNAETVLSSQLESKVGCGWSGLHFFYRPTSRIAKIRTVTSQRLRQRGTLRGLKPSSSAVRYGTAEAVPFPHDPSLHLALRGLLRKNALRGKSLRLYLRS